MKARIGALLITGCEFSAMAGLATMITGSAIAALLRLGTPTCGTLRTLFWP